MCVCLSVCVCVCAYKLLYKQDAIQDQFYTKYNRFEFRVFLLLDWLPCQD